MVTLLVLTLMYQLWLTYLPTHRIPQQEKKSSPICPYIQAAILNFLNPYLLEGKEVDEATNLLLAGPIASLLLLRPSPRVGCSTMRG